jgi:hypothetical protein
MKHRWAALIGVLALSAAIPCDLSAQAAQPPNRGRITGGLGQNYPNPFNPETRIPFSVGDSPTCSEPGRQYRVSLRIYNLLTQLVAVPVLQGGTGSVAGGQPLENVLLTCGQYTAYWDGKYQNSSREAASGVYIYRLAIDKQLFTRKMLSVK